MKYSEPIDDANKLLYDLDQQIQLIISGHDSIKPSTKDSNEFVSPLAYSDSAAKLKIEIMSKNVEGQEFSKEPLAIEDNNNINNLVNNLGELDKKLQVSA